MALGLQTLKPRRRLHNGIPYTGMQVLHGGKAPVSEEEVRKLLKSFGVILQATAPVPNIRASSHGFSAHLPPDITNQKQLSVKFIEWAEQFN